MQQFKVKNWLAVAFFIVVSNAYAEDSVTDLNLLDTLNTNHVAIKQKPQWANEMTSSWNLTTGWDSFDHVQDRGDSAYLYFKSDFYLPLASWIHVKVSPRIDLYSARVQERFDTEGYKNSLRLSEGYVGVVPTSFLEIRGGFINQGSIEQPMMVSSGRAFPGVAEILGFVSGKVNISFTAEQVVPTSYSVDSERESKEALPRLFVETLEVKGQNLKLLEWSARGGLYAWKDLPDKVAFESAMAGNSVVGEVAPGAQFRSAFNGWHGGVDLCIGGQGSVVQGLGEFRRVQNVAAAAGLQNAQSWGVGPRILVGERALEIMYRRFFVEKDAAIAIYNSSNYGGTNRQGDAVEVKLDFKDHQFAILGGWSNSLTLRDNPNQNTLTTYFIGLETASAPF